MLNTWIPPEAEIRQYIYNDCKDWDLTNLIQHLAQITAHLIGAKIPQSHAIDYEQKPLS